jgi:diacylglycerol kinase (ATP)
LKALLVHSPHAGTDPEPAEPIIARLEDAGLEVRYCEHGKDDIAAMMVGVDMAVAAGGDGTVTSVATQLPDRSVPIAILPMGGSNNIARAMGIRQSVDQVMAGLDDMSERQLTVGRASGPFGTRLFLEAVGIGALNVAIEQVDEAPDTPEEKRENGRKAFREALANAASFVAEVDIDGRALSGPWLLVEILNIGAIGPRLPFAPRADTQDALLDILLVKESERDAMLGWAEHFSGPPPACITTGRNIRLAAHGLCPRIDDRPIDMPPESWDLDICLEEQPVTILIPKLSLEAGE